MTPRVLVIGWGNMLRGDDALGPLAAQRLRERAESSHVQILIRQTLTPELAAEIGGCELVVFLDASVDGPDGDLGNGSLAGGPAAGREVACREIFAKSPQDPSLTHGLDPAGLLLLAQVLSGRSPRAYLISVRGVSFDLSSRQLTPAVAAAVEPVLEKTRTLIEKQTGIVLWNGNPK